MPTQHALLSKHIQRATLGTIYRHSRTAVCRAQILGSAQMIIPVASRIVTCHRAQLAATQPAHTNIPTIVITANKRPAILRRPMRGFNSATLSLSHFVTKKTRRWRVFYFPFRIRALLLSHSRCLIVSRLSARFLP